MYRSKPSNNFQRFTKSDRRLTISLFWVNFKTYHLKKRFCNKLGLPDSSSKLAEKIAKLVREKDGLYGRNYISVAAAAIYVVAQLSSLKTALAINDIAAVSGTSELTIRSAYKAMFPYRTEIVSFLIKNNINIETNYIKQ